jgi:hypothetical protein
MTDGSRKPLGGPEIVRQAETQAGSPLTPVERTMSDRKTSPGAAARLPVSPTTTQVGSTVRDQLAAEKATGRAHDYREQ